MWKRNFIECTTGLSDGSVKATKTDVWFMVGTRVVQAISLSIFQSQFVGKYWLGKQLYDPVYTCSMLSGYGILHTICAQILESIQQENRKLGSDTIVINLKIIYLTVTFIYR